MATSPAARPLPVLTPEDWMSGARMLAENRAPYMMDVLYGLILQVCESLGTFGVSERAVLYWDPEMRKQWTPGNCAAVLLHECMHVLRGHCQRCRDGNYDGALWNVADDFEVNDDLEEMLKGDPVVTLPGEYLHPRQINAPCGLLSEEYYHLLLQQQPPPPPSGGAGNDSPEGGTIPALPSGGKGKGGKGKDKPQQDQQGPGAGKGAKRPGTPQAGGGWCGSGAGRKVPGEPEGPDAEGRSEMEIALIRQAVAHAVMEEVKKSSRQQGTVPLGMQRWAEDFLKPPKISWHAKLARMSRRAVAYRAGQTESTYTRISRRQAGIGFGPGKPIVSALRQPVIDVWVVLDTSGSMSDGMISAALTEIVGVMKCFGVRLTFLAADAGVHSMKVVDRPDDLAKLVRGGGGTSFCPAFEAAAQAKHKPRVIIYATDGFGDAPAHPPIGMDVIWVLMGEGCRRPCSWGEEVFVDVEPS